MKKILFLLIGLLFPLQALGAGISVSPQPIFNITNWAPGQSYTQDVTVTNTSGQDRLLGLKLDGKKSGLSDMITIKVVQKWDGTSVLEKSLSDIYEAGETGLGTIPSNSVRHYDFTATFSPEAGNDLQGTTQSFDLSFGFISEEAPDYQDETIPEQTNPVTDIATNLRTAVTTITPAINSEIDGQTAEPKDVKAATDTGTTKKGETPCPWWWVVAIVLALVLAVYSLVVKETDRKDERKYMIVSALPAVFAVAAWVAHYYLHRSGNYSNTIYCDYFWLLALVEALVAYFLYYWLFQREKETR